MIRTSPEWILARVSTCLAGDRCLFGHRDFENMDLRADPDVIDDRWSGDYPIEVLRNEFCGVAIVLSPIWRKRLVLGDVGLARTGFLLDVGGGHRPHAYSVPVATQTLSSITSNISGNTRTY